MNNNEINFLTHIYRPMSQENLYLLLNSNNITFEKCELYSDFVKSLLAILFDTYLGDDVTNAEDQIKHFNWCWKKNVSNFAKEGISIDSLELYTYFLEFSIETFYTIKEKNKNTIDYIEKLSLKIWYSIFNFNALKTSAEFNTLLEVYDIFEKSFNNRIKIG